MESLLLKFLNNNMFWNYQERVLVGHIFKCTSILRGAFTTSTDLPFNTHMRKKIRYLLFSIRNLPNIQW